MTRTRKNRKNKENIRGLILETALRLFTLRGYFNTSVHDIQRASDVSIGSMYHYFKNKEGIAKALYDDLVERMAQVMEDILADFDTAHDRCRAVVSFLFELTEQSPETMQYILYARHREFMPDAKPICSSRPFDLMMQMVRDGIENGEIRDIEPVVAAASLFGGLIRLIHLKLDKALNGTLNGRLDEVWGCAWRAVSP